MNAEVRPLISPVGPIYTTADTAALLHVSVRTVQRLIRARQLRSYKVGRVYRILGSDIENFFRQQHPESANTPA
jgi:excisionase family DNA binding protein